VKKSAMTLPLEDLHDGLAFISHNVRVCHEMFARTPVVVRLGILENVMKKRVIVMAAAVAFAVSGCSQAAKKEAAADAEATGPVDAAPAEGDEVEAVASETVDEAQQGADQDEAAARAEADDTANAAPSGGNAAR
jgi:hypothetical protein